MTNDPTSAAYEALVQDGFIDALIEHYLSHQERYKTADAETQELDYDSFVTEWSGKLSKLLAEAERRGEQIAIDSVYRMSPTKQFKDWKPEDALAFYEQLKAYEGLLQANADGANGRDGEDSE